jgi:exodeoxyribonuclease V alpha subunit
MCHNLKGQIERITYTNEENGYSVVKLKVYGRKDLVCAVGSMMAPTPGEILDLKGEWTTHPKFGEQFKITHYETEVPATVYGIQKYLGSGLIKGIGPVMAKRIVKKFGESTLEVIEDHPEKLSSVEGIGKKRIGMIQTAWDEQKEIREVMLFLQSHGVSSGYATKIFKQYGDQSISVVQENPYRLAMDIFGIGFVTADTIAEKLGFDKQCEIRAEAGFLYMLHQMADEGHVYYPYEPLVQKCHEMLEIDQEAVTRAISANVLAGRIVLEDLNDDSEAFLENNKAVFLKKFHVSETGIAARIKRLLTHPKPSGPLTRKRPFCGCKKELAIHLAEKQMMPLKRLPRARSW